MKLLERSFYRRHPAEVAPDLLGKVLVRQVEGDIICGKIVETEAYCSTDPASHTFAGLTDRNRAMFGEVGHAYIYFIHGLHHCLNITARHDTDAGGVLIRALEPHSGIAQMRRRRGREDLRSLTSGPAKLTQALAIDKSLYGCDMTQEGALYVTASNDNNPLCITATPRIGISRAKEVPWRFVIDGHDCLSK